VSTTSKTPDRKAVLSALEKVHEPALKKPITEIGALSGMDISDKALHIDLALTTAAAPLRAQVTESIRSILRDLHSEWDIEIAPASPLDPEGPNALRSIAVASGKGGVGKSTMAVNLAVSIAQSGSRVGLLDADIYGPNIPTMMGLKGLPEAQQDQIVPAEAFGVKVMSIGFLVPGDQPIIWRGPMLHGAIRQFIHDVAWGSLDYLIIDLPPGTGDAQLSLAQTISLTGGVIVTLPQQVSLEDARRGLEMFRAMEVPIFGIVENMSFLEMPDGQRVDVFGEGGGEKLAEAAETEFLGMVPIDPSVRMGGDQGLPIVVSKPNSPAAAAIVEIMQKVVSKALQSRIPSSDLISIEMID
jgi:ATP-binding protein involved in chromosome partitioning